MRRLASAVDFSFVCGLVKKYYSHTGQPSIDPVVIFKLSLLGYLFNISSERIGSTRLVTDSAGASQASYTFDAYGRLVGSSGTVTNPIRFAGQYQDAESGLYYLRARYYDPATGQFISRDRWTPVTRKPYAYTDDNPLNGTDPTGLYDCGWQPWNCVHAENLLPQNWGSWGSQITANWNNPQARTIAFVAGVTVGMACAIGGCMAGAAELLTGVSISAASAVKVAIVTMTSAVATEVGSMIWHAVEPALKPQDNFDNITNGSEEPAPDTSCPATNPEWLKRIPHEIGPVPGS